MQPRARSCWLLNTLAFRFIRRFRVNDFGHDADVKMHQDELDIHLSVLQNMIADQFSEWSDLQVVPVISAGTVNAIFRVGDQLAGRM